MIVAKFYAHFTHRVIRKWLFGKFIYVLEWTNGPVRDVLLYTCGIVKKYKV